MARELLGMAMDENITENLRLNAIRDALDRGGVIGKTTVDVSVTAAPYERMLAHVESGSRTKYRRSIGIEDNSDARHEFPCASDDLIVDVDVDVNWTIIEIEVEAEVMSEGRAYRCHADPAAQ